MAEPETAQRQTTLSRDKKPRERERISPSRSRVGVHLRLCFSRGSNEDLPLLQSATCVRDSHHHHQRRSIGVKSLDGGEKRGISVPAGVAKIRQRRCLPQEPI